MRILRLSAAVLLGLLTITPLAAAPAAAAVPVPWAPWIKCDAAAGTITTGLHHGNLVPGRKVSATFIVGNGQATTSSGIASIPEYGQSTVVTGTVGANYTLDMAGYTRAWDPSRYLYYSETVRVVLAYADGGGTIWTGDIATCQYDPRNTYSITCGGDPAAFAISVTGTRATASGADPEFLPSRITYRQFIDENTGSGFARHYQADDVARRIVRDAETGNDWADPGISTDLSRHVSFTSHVSVSITNVYGRVVGGSTFVCDYTA